MKSIPKYESIVNYIRDGIQSGIYKENDQLPTEMEFVKMFSTSRPTVVKAMDKLLAEKVIYRIQGKGSFVSAQCSEKEKNQSKIISLVLPFAEYRNSNRRDELHIIKGIENYFRNNGYSLMIHYCDNEEQSFVNTVKAKRDTVCQGMILYPIDKLDDIACFYDLILDQFPVVLIDKPITGLEFPRIETDNVRGGYLATEHLIRCGYDVLYFISDVDLSEIKPSCDRYYGFLKATRELGKSSESNLILTRRYARYLTPEILRDILLEISERHKNKKVGLFIVNDNLAYGILYLLAQLDLSIQNQFGVVGFGGLNISLPQLAQLTTIEENFFKIGELAAKTMLDVINGTASPQTVLRVDAKLRIGETTCKSI